MENKRIDKKKIVIIAGVGIFLVILLLFLSMLCIAKFDNKIRYDIYLNGKSILGYNPNQLRDEVTNISENIKKEEISIMQNGKEIYKVSSDNIDLDVDISDTIKKVLDVSKNKNIFENMVSILGFKGNYIDIDYSITYNEEKMDTLLKNIDLTLDSRVVYDSYYLNLDEGKITFTKGEDGELLDFDKAKEDILNSFKSNIKSIEIATKKTTSNVLDSKKIKEKVSVTSKDAYIDNTIKPVKFVKEEKGIEVDENEVKVAIAALAKLNAGETVDKEITVIEPKVYLKDIYYDTYNDKLASFTTYFAGSQTNRSNNIKIASSYINDKEIMPGETFSFNDAVGEITLSKGYLMAATFSGGKVVDGLGGGVCQVSSTLYNTALMANLEITERYAHSLPVSYVLPSRDATIYVGVLDLKIKNTRNHAVKILTSYSPTGSLTISLYGTKEEKEYDIDIESHVIEEIKPKTEYVNDSSIEKEKEETVQGGTSGCISEAYLVKKYNGKVVERKLLSRDVYSSMNKIVKVNRN